VWLSLLGPPLPPPFSTQPGLARVELAPAPRLLLGLLAGPELGVCLHPRVLLLLLLLLVVVLPRELLATRPTRSVPFIVVSLPRRRRWPALS
jgi:hypothetical protein